MDISAPRSRSASRLARLALAGCTGWLLGAAGLVTGGPVRAAEPVKPAAAGTSATKPVPKAAAKPPARPAARPAPAPLVPGKPIEPLLTRDELRACMARQEKLRNDSAEGARQQQALGKEKDEILREGEALKADLVTLDRSSAPALEAYNARVKARDERIAAFEPAVAAFNASVGTLDADRAAFTKDCADRKFDEKDEEALKREK